MNKNRKNLHRVTANVLGITLASVMAAGPVAEAAAPINVFAAVMDADIAVKKAVYLNGSLEKIPETADGSTKKNAVNTLGRALELAGVDGIVYVCGTITVSSEQKVSIPAGVTVNRAEGFGGPLVKITGEGKLTVVGTGIQAEDVDTANAQLGKDAFKIKKRDSVVTPAEITLKTPQEWNAYAFGAMGFSGNGTFAWKNAEVPAAYEASAEVVFTPNDIENYDYAGIAGWNPESGKVVRTLKVTVESLKPQEEEKEPEEPPVEPEQKPEEPPVEEVKEQAVVEMPQEAKFQTKEEWENSDFTALGFKGDGTFAWESEPSVYEGEINAVFTPADVEKFDYTQVQGWNEETKTVVRSVKVTVESFNTSSGEEEKGPETKPGEENPDESKPEEEPGKKNPDESKPEEEPDKENPNESKPEDGEQNKDNTEKEEVIIIPAEEEEPSEPEDTDTMPEDTQNFAAQPGQNGEAATEVPEALPVGSLIDESGVQVYGDFIPFYVDLQVSYNDAVDEMPDAGIGEILSAYELKLWDLKEDEEYKIPEGKKVKVMIPLPENANEFSDLAIAHYLDNGVYEYFSFDKEGKTGNMTIEEQNGKEYLVFETASFSPFNVGGSQLVGAGTPSKGHQLPNGGNSSSNKTNNKGNNSTISDNKNSSGNKNNTGNSYTGNKNATIIPVQTGDSTNIMTYLLVGAGALVLAVVTLALGKKKK